MKLIANGARDSAPLRELRTKVETAGVTGEGIICLAHLNLKILDKEIRQLSPYIDAADKGSNRTGYNPRRAFTIEVKDSRGSPRANQEVLLQTAFRPKSGGHDHSHSHDTIMTWGLKGRFWAQHKNNNPLKGIKTGADGRLAVDSLRASMFSGSYIVYATLVSDTTVFDSVALDVRVPDFVEFGSGDKWVLTGVPGQYDHGLNHPSNHWCTQTVKDALEVVLADFYDWSMTPEGGGTAIRLGVNDMAFEWGGVFDIEGEWEQGFHVYHRVGCSVDIDQTGGLKETATKLTSKGEKLVRLMKLHEAKKYPEGPIHFGFDGSR